MAKNLTFLQAVALATATTKPAPVRRIAWELWIYNGPPLWFLWAPAGTNPEALRVCVGAMLSGSPTLADVAAADMLANDWTDEPWTDPTTNAAGPLPPAFAGGYAPATTPPAAPTFGTIIDPPGPTAANQLPQIIYGGSPAGSGGTPPTVYKPHNPPAAQTPVVTVKIIPPSTSDLNAAAAAIGHSFNGTCFSLGGAALSVMTLSVLGFNVSVAGGPEAGGFLSYTLAAGTPPGTDNAYPGFAAGHDVTALAFFPGGTITLTATYVVHGTGATYTGSASYTFPTPCGWTLPTSVSVTIASVVGTTYNWTATISGGTDSADQHVLTVTMAGQTGTVTTAIPGGIYSGSLSYGTTESGATITATYAYPTGNIVGTATAP